MSIDNTPSSCCWCCWFPHVLQVIMKDVATSGCDSRPEHLLNTFGLVEFGKSFRIAVGCQWIWLSLEQRKIKFKYSWIWIIWALYTCMLCTLRLSDIKFTTICFYDIFSDFMETNIVVIHLVFLLWLWIPASCTISHFVRTFSWFLYFALNIQWMLSSNSANLINLFICILLNHLQVWREKNREKRLIIKYWR